MDYSDSVADALREHVLDGFALYEQDEGLYDYKKALLDHANSLIAGNSTSFPTNIAGKCIPQFVDMFPTIQLQNSDSMSSKVAKDSFGYRAPQIISERVIEEMDIIRIEVDVLNDSDCDSFHNLDLIMYSDATPITCESATCTILYSRSKVTLVSIIHRSSLFSIQSNICASIFLSYSLTQDSSIREFVPALRSVRFRRWWFSQFQSDNKPKSISFMLGSQKQYSCCAGIVLSIDNQNLGALSSVLTTSLGFTSSNGITEKQQQILKFSRSDVDVVVQSISRCDAQITISSFCQNRICSVLKKICCHFPERSISVSVDMSAQCYSKICGDLSGSLRLEIQHYKSLLYEAISDIIANGGPKASDQTYSNVRLKYLENISKMSKLQMKTDIIAGKVLSVFGYR